jgi:alkaline phosphatase D
VVGCDAVQDPARSLLGEAQEAWLTQGLRQGGAQWSLIGQSTLMASAGLDTPLGRTHYTDGWDGYVPSRDRLLATIEEARLKDVVVLGGDVHAHFAAVLRRRANDPASPVLASELVCTSVSSRGPGAALLSRMQAANPDLLHARGDERGYIRLDITPQALHADMRGTPAPALPGSVLRSQARWVVPSGQAGPQRAA